VYSLSKLEIGKKIPGGQTNPHPSGPYFGTRWGASVINGQIPGDLQLCSNRREDASLIMSNGKLYHPVLFPP